ncbi:translation initiation factor eIF-5 [Pseudohyphozyma bogoriensis]|nr:translation initiation factor eIF-5 [Pseudohyphozyma bogoriensis]
MGSRADTEQQICRGKLSVVNIRRDVQDSFYRYKMPVLQTKIEGKGNGIKTVIPNMADVARALNRPSAYPTKYFGCELGAQATFNDENERYIVNGSHDASRLRDLLDGFIDKFVLCASCKNPETELIITKDEFILRDCKACGKRGNVDMRHKLVTFILKNPPKSKRTTTGRGKKATAGADAMQADEESDDELTKKIEAGAEKVMSEEQARALIEQREKDDDWSIDTSEEAVKARVAALDSKLQSALIIEGEDDDEGGGPYDDFGQWVKENKDEVSDVDIYKKAEESGLAKKHKTLVVLVQAMFTDKIVAELPKHLGILKKMTTSEKHQKSLLGGVERLVGKTYPQLVKTDLPKILMALYQADIIEEELVTDWSKHTSKKYVSKDISKQVRKAAAPFVKWLAEAEDDSDEESE